MTYRFLVLPGAAKQLRTLPEPLAKRIYKKLRWIARQDSPLRYSVFLHDSRIGDVRFRIGEYRVVAIVDQRKRVIAIAAVGHRKEVYRS